MFDPQIFEESDPAPLKDWVAMVLVIASYGMAFLAGWLAG
jgi:hypothetical protein